MQKVTGIGGIFFPAEDPRALSEWYEKHLGVSMPPATYEQEPWQQKAGPTVFAPMGKSSEHFKAGAQLHVNFRVDDLDAMCRKLEASGIPVTVDPEQYPNGRFASLEDPEGNQIQLWEPSRGPR